MVRYNQNVDKTKVIDCEPPFDVLKITGVTIMSPNYPYNYRKNEYCQVTLTFPEGQQVHLEFEDLGINEWDNGKCEGDRLEIRDGDDLSPSPSLTKLCGFYNPRRIKSTGNSVTLTFKTNRNSVTRTGRGFKLKVDSGNIKKTISLLVYEFEKDGL